MPARPLLRLALAAFPRVPRGLRRQAVRLVTPAYTVGTVLVVRDGAEILLLRQRHYAGLSLPGGLLRRGEDARDGLRRELREEVGLDAELGEPAAVVVEPRGRRVDLVFTARLRGDRGAIRPDRVEATAACWRRADDVADATPSTRLALDRLATADARREGAAWPA